MHVLWLLREMGLDPASEEARRAVSLVRDRVTWHGCAPPEADHNPFFAGEVEPCINGRTVKLGVYFDQDVEDIVTRLVGEQLEDGGWNCEAENGSVRSSFASTINVLEGLLAYERATGGGAAMTAVRSTWNSSGCTATTMSSTATMPAIAASPLPAAAPATSGTLNWATTARRMWTGRAPSARRTPISRRRCETVKATIPTSPVTASSRADTPSTETSCAACR